MPDEIQESNQDQVAVDSLLKGDLTFDDLTPEQAEMAMQKHMNQEAPPEAELGQPKEVTSEPVEAGKTQAELATEVDPRHEEIHKLQVALNKANQKAQTATDRYERQKTEVPEVKKAYTYDKNRDMLDDDYLGEISISKQKIDALEAKLESWETKESEAESARVANKAHDDLFTEINALQEEFPTLKTSIPFRDFNTKYNTWNSRMQESGKDITKYMNDATYRAEVDATGLAPNLQLADISKGLDIFSGVHKMNEDKAAGFNSDFSRAFKDTKAYKSAYDSKYRGPELADERALNERVAEINSQATIMRPTEVLQGQVTHESLKQELANPNITDERFEEINQLIMAQIRQQNKG